MLREIVESKRILDKIVQDVTNFIFVNFEKVTIKHKIDNGNLEIKTSRPLSDAEKEKILDKFNFISGEDHSYGDVTIFQLDI